MRAGITLTEATLQVTAARLLPQSDCEQSDESWGASGRLFAVGVGGRGSELWDMRPRRPALASVCLSPGHTEKRS